MDTTAGLEPQRTVLDAGQEGTFVLSVRNDSEIVEDYALRVVGDLAEWATVEPTHVSVFPGHSATALVTLTPPRSSAVAAGEHPLGVHVRPVKRSENAAVPEGVVEVLPFFDTVAELSPQSTKSRKGGTYRVAVDNRGNAPVAVALAAKSASDGLGVALSETEQIMEPGTTWNSEVHTEPVKKLWRGAPVAYPFTIMVKPEEGPATALAGTQHQTPVLPPWTFRSLAGLLALAVGAVVLFVSPVGKWACGALADPEPPRMCATLTAGTDTEAQGSDNEKGPGSDEGSDSREGPGDEADPGGEEGSDEAAGSDEDEGSGEDEGSDEAAGSGGEEGSDEAAGSGGEEGSDEAAGSGGEEGSGDNDGSSTDEGSDGAAGSGETDTRPVVPTVPDSIELVAPPGPLDDPQALATALWPEGPWAGVVDVTSIVLENPDGYSGRFSIELLDVATGTTEMLHQGELSNLEPGQELVRDPAESEEQGSGADIPETLQRAEGFLRREEGTSGDEDGLPAGEDDPPVLEPIERFDLNEGQTLLLAMRCYPLNADQTVQAVDQCTITFDVDGRVAEPGTTD